MPTCVHEGCDQPVRSKNAACPPHRLCRVPGCTRLKTPPAGYCGTHQNRLTRHGRLHRPSVDERFDVKWHLDPVTACHIWDAGHDTNGYGLFHSDHQTRSHVYAYERKYGPVPAGLVLDHYVCSNRGCCNPDHLRPVSNMENLERSVGCRSVIHRAKTECIHGHPFDAANTYIRPDNGTRQCRQCVKDRHARTAQLRLTG